LQQTIRSQREQRRLAANANAAAEKNNVSHDTIPGFMERSGDAYAAEIRDFIEAIETGRDVSVTGKDAWTVTAITVASTLSLDEGRPVLVREVR
jgi:myo-inositol 2-dehydrogenase/D-chiro-inositol 1-dehydrogenase